MRCSICFGARLRTFSSVRIAQGPPTLGVNDESSERKQKCMRLHKTDAILMYNRDEPAGSAEIRNSEPFTEEWRNGEWKTDLSLPQ